MISNPKTVLARLLASTLLLTLLVACNLEKEISINLPEYEQKYLVECYLEAGKPYKLFLGKTVSYFDPPSLPLVQGAKVKITIGNKTEILNYEVLADTAQRKIYNYTSKSLVPKDYTNEFKLEIVTKEGELISSACRLLRPVPIDSIGWKFRDSLAYILVQFPDAPAQKNYYRIVMNENNVRKTGVRDFSVDDRLFDGKMFTTATRYDFKKNDTIKNKVYHIDKAWYDFLESTEDARRANGNPFAQPAAVTTNIKGGVGIFTGVSYSQKTVIIK